MIGISGSMMCLVDDEIIKRIILKLLQIECNTLDASTDYMSIGLLNAVHIATHRNLAPQLFKGGGCLLHQLYGVGKKQHSATAAFGIHHGGNGLSCARCVVQKSDGFTVGTHFIK